MRATYDSEANAIGIALIEDPRAETSEGVHSRGRVALAGGTPVDVELLYPDLGIEEPLSAIAERFDLDLQALTAAAHSALDAPDREIVLHVLERA